MLIDIVKLINASKSQEEALKILKKNSINSSLIWLLKVIYNPNFVVGPLKKIEIDDSNGLDKGIVFQEVVDLLVKERISYGQDSDLIYSLYINAHPAHSVLFDWMQSRSINGIKPSQINKIFGENVVCDLKVPNVVGFKNDMVCKGDKLVSFEKKNGSFISIVKYGRSIEVFSKNGNPYLIFDEIRKAFENVPFDGRFLAQLYYQDENGNSSIQQFLSETAKKQQSENFFCEVFDYVPLSIMNTYTHTSIIDAEDEKFTFKVRNSTAKYIVDKFVNDKRIFNAKIESFDQKSDKSCYIVDQNAKHGLPIMLKEIKKEK